MKSVVGKVLLVCLLALQMQKINGWMYGEVGKMVDTKPYVTAVGSRIVELLQEKDITGKYLPIKDFISPLNDTDYGIKVAGFVNFHSGFVSSIETMELDFRYFIERMGDNASLEIDMLWKHPSIVLDFNCDFEDYSAPGTMLITYGHFKLPLKIWKNLFTQEVSASLTFQSISSQNDIVITAHPNNHYVQLISKNLKKQNTFRQPLEDSFKLWNFEDIVKQAIKEIDFPEVCYHC